MFDANLKSLYEAVEILVYFYYISLTSNDEYVEKTLETQKLCDREIKNVTHLR